MKENNFDEETIKKINATLRSFLSIKEKIECINKIERNLENNGYIVTYTSHESDDGWQYDSEQNTIEIRDFEITRR